MQNIQKAFGLRVRQLRVKKGWTQDEFADIAGFHRAYVGAVERGERNLTLKNIHILAQALKVRIGDLTGGIDD